MVNIFQIKALDYFPFKDYKWKVTTDNRSNKTTFWLRCHIYYKTLGSLHFGILYNWFWQWLREFGLLHFHPGEIKHQNLRRCVMGQRLTICSAKSDFKDLEKSKSWQCLYQHNYLGYFFEDFKGSWVANWEDFVSNLTFVQAFQKPLFTIHPYTPGRPRGTIGNSGVVMYLLVLPRRLHL